MTNPLLNLNELLQDLEEYLKWDAELTEEQKTKIRQIAYTHQKTL